MSHKTDPELRKRLKRAEGHLSSVVRMVDDGRDALAIAQQIQAVVRALEQAKRLLIHDHIDHHLVEASGAANEETRRLLAEFREITKYL
ncbi:metal-sensing transcriptional repressor [Aurantimonas sp. VKM B-3413]|uniref:metal-sensing transcriptional repressor n=1 Tax=Aurantimonas sp. VKM B-3413 TaxID=2779401 RepID=UPI001E40A6D5|nr:metal-sensing transcriptional repressor [Aurantimonas sp. VKM B-3413]MCB8838464.1 metal-sensing transcriptional repressor [Aurantimonas sp. VKM B-3413]